MPRGKKSKAISKLEVTRQVLRANPDGTIDDVLSALRKRRMTGTRKTAGQMLSVARKELKLASRAGGKPERRKFKGFGQVVADHTVLDHEQEVAKLRRNNLVLRDVVALLLQEVTSGS